jgi:hypothetical protein
MAATSKARKKKSPDGKGTEIATPLKMRDVRCTNLSYRFKVALEKFDINALRDAMNTDQTTKRGYAVCSTRNSDAADYHAHFEWRLREKQQEVTVEIQYVTNSIESKPGEDEPFAESVMLWVGRFFKRGDANARVHSDFAFDAKTATLSWFPLPLRTKVSGLQGEAILDGIAIALPSQPDSVSRFFLSHINDSVFVGIESARRIRFTDFSLDKELKIEKAFADKVVEVKS